MLFSGLFVSASFCPTVCRCVRMRARVCVCVRVTSAEIRRRRAGIATSRRCDCEIIDLHEERVIVVAVATSRAPWVVYQQPLIAHHSLQCQNRAERALPCNLSHHGNCILTSYGAMQWQNVSPFWTAKYSSPINP